MWRLQTEKKIKIVNNKKKKEEKKLKNKTETQKY